MEPREKANELVKKCYSIFPMSGNQHAKQCALIAAETHIYSENDSPFPTMQSWIEDSKFWNEVKSEIEKL